MAALPPLSFFRQATLSEHGNLHVEPANHLSLKAFAASARKRPPRQFANHLGGLVGRGPFLGSQYRIPTVRQGTECLLASGVREQLKPASRSGPVDRLVPVSDGVGDPAAATSYINPLTAWALTRSGHNGLRHRCTPKYNGSTNRCSDHESTKK
jgi:hypothetical protein